MLRRQYWNTNRNIKRWLPICARNTRSNVNTRNTRSDMNTRNTRSDMNTRNTRSDMNTRNTRSDLIYWQRFISWEIIPQTIATYARIIVKKKSCCVINVAGLHYLYLQDVESVNIVTELNITMHVSYDTDLPRSNNSDT